MACLSGGCAPSRIRLLVIGTFSSGKTTILRKLAGKIRQGGTVATLGLREQRQQIEEFKVNFLDMGGADEVIPKWPLFYGHVHGFLYALDTTDMKHAEANGLRLVDILQHPDVDGKPFLIIATKSDSNFAMKEEMIFNMYDMENVLAQNRNAQFCYAEDKPHWIVNEDRSETSSFVIAAKRNISYNKLKTGKNNGDDDDDVSAKRNISYNKHKTGKNNDGDDYDVSGENHNAKTVHIDSRPSFPEPTREPRDSPYMSDEGLGTESVVLEIMGLRQGILWLLEFVQSNREVFNKRVAEHRKSQNIGSTRRKLLQIQRSWERDCAKDAAAPPPPAAHGALASAHSQVFRDKISHINKSNAANANAVTNKNADNNTNNDANNNADNDIIIYDINNVNINANNNASINADADVDASADAGLRRIPPSMSRRLQADDKLHFFSSISLD